jgi:hypothetical protein
MQSLLEHMKSKERISDEALQYGLTEIATFSFWKDAANPPTPRVLPPMGEPATTTSEFQGENPPFDPWEALPPDDVN